MIQLTIIDNETRSPVAGAEVYFTEFKSKRIFDWEMNTEKVGLTNETGEVKVTFGNINDSVRIEKKGYLSMSLVMKSEDQFILVYREPNTTGNFEGKILKIDELDRIEAYPGSGPGPEQEIINPNP